MPQPGPGPRHAHRERDEIQQRLAGIVVVLDQRSIAPHPRKVLLVAMPGGAGDGLDEERTVHFLDRRLRQDLVGTVHGMARLVGDHMVPAHGLQQRADLGRCA